MENQSYRLISGLAGFLLLPHGQTLEVIIPVNAVVTVLKQPSDGTGFTRVSYAGRTCAVPMRELQRCGNAIRITFLLVMSHGRISQIAFFGSDYEHSRTDRAFGTRKREPIRSDRGQCFGVLEGITGIKRGPAGRCDEPRAADNVRN